MGSRSVGLSQSVSQSQSVGQSQSVSQRIIDNLASNLFPCFCENNYVMYLLQMAFGVVLWWYSGGRVCNVV